jgi:hypothetical protein
VTLIPRRAALVASIGRASSRLSRLGVALLMSLGLALTASACGFEVQTNNPYTPAEGVNFDAGSVNMRNVMILSRTPGEGYLSASMTSGASDALLKVTGFAIKADGSEGAPLTVTLPNPVAVGNGSMVVLTDRPLITVKSADLQAGLVARLVFQFSKAGEVTTTAPVVNADQPAYATISPSPSPSPSS